MIVAVDVDLGKQLAKCQVCQNIFSFAQVAEEEQRTKRVPAGGPAARQPTLLLPRPAKMHVDEFAGTWAVSWRWFTPVYLFLFFFCCIWDGFLVVWYAGAMNNHMGHGTNLVMALFPTLHVTVGSD